MNTKIAMGGLSILTALTLMGGSAFAAFASSATASGNTFSTGNADLLISKDNITYTSTVPGFTGTGIFPGGSTIYTFFLKNDSTSAIPLDVTVGFNNPGGANDTNLQNTLNTQFDCNNGANPAQFSVSAMLGGSVSLGSLPSGGAMTCHLTVSLPSSADNTVAGKSVSFDALFNGTGGT